MRLYHGPRVYCPPGVPRPAWLPPPTVAPPGAACAEWAVDHPEGLRATEPGGTFYPAGYLPDPEHRWIPLASGAVVLDDGLDPQRLARVVVPRSLAKTPSVRVAGTEEGHWWAVPTLLHVGADGPRALPDQVLRRAPDGTEEWALEPRLEALVYRLLAAVDAVQSGPVSNEVASEIIGLACDLLGLLYHADRDLLVSLGWISKDMLRDVIAAAVHIEEAGACSTPST